MVRRKALIWSAPSRTGFFNAVQFTPSEQGQGTPWGVAVLLLAADAAMYRAKLAGRNHVEVG